jgi:hypothetical protein
VPAFFLTARRRVARSEGAVGPVRRKLADLARGRLAGTPQQREADADPDYEDWIDTVEQARESLQARRQSVGIVVVLRDASPTPPPALAAEPHLALAADPGGDLLAGLEQALMAVRAGLRYQEVSVEGRGTLILLLHEEGVSAAWTGPEGPPPLTEALTAGQPVAARWREGPGGTLWRAEPVFPWRDGEVILAMGPPPARTIVVQQGDS